MNIEFPWHQGSILEYLTHKNRIPVPSLASMFGTSRGYIYECFNKQVLSSEMIYHACAFFKVPVSMFFSDKHEIDLQKICVIRAYDSLSKVGGPDYRDFYLSHEVGHGVAVVVLMRTDVMHPIIQPGDHLYLGEKIATSEILDSFTYLIKGDDLVTVGRVRVSGGKLRISYDNPLVKYTTIAASQVTECYPVLALSRAMSPLVEKRDDLKAE
jgi:hypothetical protein